MVRFCLFIFMAALCVTNGAYGYAGGNGEAGDPWQIAQPADWVELATHPDHWDNHFMLTANLDMQGFELTPVGDGNLGNFTGTLDGAGFTISNAVIDLPQQRYVGLIGYMGQNGRVLSLGVSQITVNGLSYVGGLAGYAQGNSQITGCRTGGLVTGQSYAGGLVGQNYGEIASCYSTAAVQAQWTAGGLVGYSYGTITHCYATGAITGDSSGGLVGDTWSLCRGCFWDMDSSGLSFSSSGKGLSTAALKSVATFSKGGWDTGDWEMTEGEYPRLEWEGTAGEPIPATEVPLAGDGSETDPWQVQTVGDFLLLADYAAILDGHLILTADLDLTGQPVTGIGELGVFRGVFDGNYRTIANATLPAMRSDNAGLFGQLDYNARVTRLGVENIAVAGRNYCGGLAGKNQGAIVSCFVTGSVTGQYSVGGLAGYNYNGSITHCYSTAAVTNTQGYDWYLGGLVGYDWTGAIIGSFWDIESSGRTGSAGGKGLTTAAMQSMIRFSRAGWDTGDWLMEEGHYPRLAAPGASGVPIEPAVIPLDGSGSYDDPYLVQTPEEMASLGQYAALLNQHLRLTANLNLSGLAIDPMGDLGPFSGRFDGGNHTLSNGAIGIESGQGGNDRMGLFRHLNYNAEVTGLTLEGFSVNGRSSVGGLAGYSYGRILDCQVQGDVTGYDYVGGLAGYCGWDSVVQDCTAQIQVVGYSYCAGGLIGTAQYCQTISGCRSQGLVTGQSLAGGLIGNNYSRAISQSYSLCAVVGYENLGGLVGTNNGPIASCYAGGSVTGNYRAGGLIGVNEWNGVVNCHASGPVEADNIVGGLAGLNSGSLATSYSTGTVTATDGTYMGGLVGVQNGSESGCFWDIDGSGQANSPAGTGLTADQMKNQQNYLDAGWDFAPEADDGDPADWKMAAGDTPRLVWENALGGQYSGGSGTTADPYRIRSELDWLALCATPADWGAHFLLEADLNLHDAALTPVGYAIEQEIMDDENGHYWVMVEKPFEGVFNGNGHAIGNASITRDGELHTGLFGLVGNGGVIRNLGVENIVISEAEYAGGLAGLNRGRLEACFVTGAVYGNINVGGLTGFNDAGAVVIDCYATASVSGSENVGGLVGWNGWDGLIASSYAAGPVTGAWSVGGLIGVTENYDPIDSFWDVIVSGLTTSAGGVGLETWQMINDNSYYLNAGWDFAPENEDGDPAVWVMPQDEAGHPLLVKRSVVPDNYGGGRGTPTDPYQIWTRADLLQLVQRPADWDKAFKLMADLNLAGLLFDRAPIAPDIDDLVWEFQGMPFTGRFDGNNHAIANLTIVNTGGVDFLGLFGLASGAHLSRLSLQTVSIQASGWDADNYGPWYVGGLTGQSQSSLLVNCSVSGEVQGYEQARHIGGLTGFATGDFWEQLAIQQCVSSAAVSGDAGVGGLVGGQLNCLISQSAATGSVTGYRHVGGLTGDSIGAVEQCASTATVMGRPGCDYLGGLIGISGGRIEDCYFNGSLTAGIYSEYVGGLAGRVSDTVARCYSAGMMTVAYPAVGSVGGLVGYNYEGRVDLSDSFWDTQTSGLDTSDGGNGRTTAQMQELDMYLNAGWDFAREEEDGNPAIWAMPQGGGYPVLINRSVTPQRYGGGSGTEADPYRIQIKAHLLELGQSPDDWGQSFKLMADLNLAGEVFDRAVIAPDTDESNWTYQGTPFSGRFDGNSHTILHLTIVNTAGGDFLGLFGQLSNAWIGNLTLDQVSIEVSGRDAEGYPAYYAGGLAGRQEFSLLENCTVIGTIFGSRDSYAIRVGGLVGEAEAYGWGDPALVGCSSSVIVSGVSYVGGLVGRHQNCAIGQSEATGAATGEFAVGGLAGESAGIIDRCVSRATVTGTAGSRYLGGLAGTADGMLRDSYHKGTVQAGWNGQYTGGLTGYISRQVIRCYSTGPVTVDGPTPAFLGGLIGFKEASATVTGSFWDTQTSSLAVSDGGVGLTTDQMQTLQIFLDAGWNFTGAGAIWQSFGGDIPRLSWEGFVRLDQTLLLSMSQCWSATGVAGTPCAAADLTDDGSVDFSDLILLAQDWLSILRQ